MVIQPMRMSAISPIMWHISARMKLSRNPESAVQTPRTAAQIKLIMTDENSGMRMLLPLYAAAAR